MIALFILIYLISFTIHILMEYKENKNIRNIGDLIDNIRFYMCFPLINTLILIVFVVGIYILKLDIIWEKFRNIKLK